MTLLHKIKQIYKCGKTPKINLSVKSIDIVAKIAKCLLFWYLEHKVFEEEVSKIYWKCELHIFTCRKVSWIENYLVLNWNIKLEDFLLDNMKKYWLLVYICWNLLSKDFKRRRKTILSLEEHLELFRVQRTSILPVTQQKWEKHVFFKMQDIQEITNGWPHK